MLGVGFPKTEEARHMLLNIQLKRGNRVALE